MLQSVAKTGLAVTAEEAQIAGGLGGVVAELLTAKLPRFLLRLGIEDRYGESGAPRQMLEHFGLTGEHLAGRVGEFVRSRHAAVRA